MILWGRASSVNVQKVLWALEDCALPYEHKIVGGIFGGNDDPEFAVLTPVRRVPVLQDGDITLWESHAILRYLARGQISPITDMWMEFGSTTLQPPFIGLFWQQVRMRKAEQDKARKKRDEESWQRREKERLLKERQAYLLATFLFLLYMWLLLGLLYRIGR